MHGYRTALMGDEMTREIAVYSIPALIVTIALTVVTAIGGPIPVGSLVGSTNATLDGQTALPHTAVLSGDSLQVNNGLAMVALGQGNRMVMGPDTEASFSKGGSSVTVTLAHGHLSLYHPEATKSFRVMIDNVAVTPSRSPRTIGEIAMIDGVLLVTARDGVLQVERAGITQRVSTGKTITIRSHLAGAPEPLPQGKRNLKHVVKVGPKILMGLGIAIGAGSTAWAIASASSSGKPASPVTP